MCEQVICIIIGTGADKDGNDDSNNSGVGDADDQLVATGDIFGSNEATGETGKENDGNLVASIIVLVGRDMFGIVCIKCVDDDPGFIVGMTQERDNGGVGEIIDVLVVDVDDVVDVARNRANGDSPVVGGESPCGTIPSFSPSTDEVNCMVTSGTELIGTSILSTCSPEDAIDGDGNGGTVKPLGNEIDRVNCFGNTEGAT
jgi:hypothetical protein